MRFCGFTGFSGFRGEERGNEDQGAASTPTCPLSARPEAFRAGMQPGSALMLPWEADFPLKIDWLCCGGGGWRGLVSLLMPTIPRRSMPGFPVLSDHGKYTENAPPAARSPPLPKGKSHCFITALSALLARQLVATTISFLEQGNIPGLDGASAAP